MQSDTQENRSLLRVSTAGSVDDGKSTLIGRLLYDCKGLYDDHLADLKKKSGNEEIDFSYVTDGLKAEREQKITIDVAYRYFSTPKRHFILADTPGHEQYTRNMATGASTSNVAILLVDAKKGISPQTRRHAFISSLLGVPRLVVAVNKMDLVDWSEERFSEIRADFTQFAAKLRIREIKFIPVCALNGANIVHRSAKTRWYDDVTLVHFLEEVYVESDRNTIDFRFPIQYVIRPDASFRGYAGQVASGKVRVGDEVVALPSGRTTHVKSIETFDGVREFASTSQSVVITLKDEIDISRGDMLARVKNQPRQGAEFEASLVWVSERPMIPGQTYKLKHTSRLVKAALHAPEYKIDVDTLSRVPATNLSLNEIGRVRLQTSQPLYFDTYEKNRATGSFIVIDPESGGTVAAGMIVDRLPVGAAEKEKPKVTSATNIVRTRRYVTTDKWNERLGQKGVTLWMTGLPGSGKSSIAATTERKCFEQGMLVKWLDGDDLRFGLSSNLGFSSEERAENIRRAAEAARLFNDMGIITLCSLISPLMADRERARKIIGPDRFVEVFVATELEICRKRDPKGLYEKAMAGKIENFTGVSSPYERPLNADIELDTLRQSVEETSQLLIDLVRSRIAKP